VEGNIWIGSHIGGLSRYSGKRFSTFSKKDGLNSNIILTICEDNNHNILLGTYGRGFSVIKKKKQDEKLTIDNFSTMSGLTNNEVWDIIKDSDGNLWLATMKGLSILSSSDVEKFSNPNFSELKIQFNNFDNTNGIIHNNIFCITEDNYGNIWLGTRGGITLIPKSRIAYLLDSQLKQQNVFVNFKLKGGRLMNMINSILQDNNGDIWIGSTFGLSIITSEIQKKINDILKIEDNVDQQYLESYLKEPIFHNFSEENKLPAKPINHITKDKSGNIWFVIDGFGIARYSTDGNIKAYTVKDGLSSDSPVLMALDRSGNLWIGSNKGLDRFDGEDFKFYGKSEGFIGLETNHGAVYNDHEGNLWFGTVNGAIRYNPSEDKKNTVEPITRISKLRIFLKEAIMPSDLELTYDQNHITFDYVGISLTNPEKVRYQVQMEGFDKDWMDVVNATYVTYSNLPPGNYTFKVRAQNNDGIWNKNAASYSFEIIPPFWQTWWFYVICTITLIVLIYTFIIIRIKNLEETKRVLEETVDLRTQEVVHQKEEIEQKNQTLETANIEIEKQKTLVELKNKDITDSIKYAKQIQEAILPNKKEIKEALPNSFMYYKPKDIVSGDFYWFAQNENKSILAVVDCTGHGVPGAFMSVVGNTLLNQIVKQKKIYDPATILTELHKGVRNALRQDEKDSESRDGMDISICMIVTKNPDHPITQASDIEKFVYASANRPLFHVSNGEINIIKGTKAAIGGLQMEEKREFENEEIIIKDGDAIYMSSDGYIDQFGGPQSKKFMTRRFKELAIDNCGNDVQLQYDNFRARFNKWIEDQEQIDDILVIGIQF